MKRREPTMEDCHLCWEPCHSHAKEALAQIRRMYDNAGSMAVTDGEHVLSFLSEMEKQLCEVEEEYEVDHADWLQFNERQELRVVNEEQLQEAVKFLTAVWQGEITDATMEQVAAARCFMRVE